MHNDQEFFKPAALLDLAEQFAAFLTLSISAQIFLSGLESKNKECECDCQIFFFFHIDFVLTSSA